MSTLGPPSAETKVPPESAVSRLWRTVSIFLPSPVREASKEGLLRTLVYLVLSITVLPLLVAFLAAFWLSTIRHHVGLDFVQSLRNSYVSSIQDGFSIDELVARKLDYVQSIVVHLQPNGPPVNFPIYLEPRQHAQITLTTVLPNTPESAACRYEEIERHTRLVAVRLGALMVLQCEMTVDGACSRTLDEAWWRENGSRLGQDIVGVPPLTFARDEAVANACAEVEIEGRVMVYKDVYQ